ncbi:thymidylate synthase [Candidatus Nomurabacteria bacterium]|nr:thymidylate synthase [Candidatus Nomurabacteria bacterium]
MITYTVTTIAQAHEKMMREIIWKHDEITTEDGEHTWESDTIGIEITNPLEDMIHYKSSFGKQRCDEYTEQLLKGTKSEFDYTYNQRLFGYEVHAGDGEHEYVNQIESLINHLKQNPQTRRAMAITWSPKYDCFDNKYLGNVPCLQLLQYTIRSGKLHCKAIFRSNDVLSAFGPNAYGLVRLQEHISKELRYPVGTYTHIALIPHVYPIRDKADLQRWM